MQRQAKQILAGSVFFLLLMGEPVYAGSLNANEQELMSVIRGTYTYEGVTYRVKADYIHLAEEYLLQDSVDCTEEQKQKALNRMFSSVQQGIDEGYLEIADGAAVTAAGSMAGRAETGDAGEAGEAGKAGEALPGEGGQPSAALENTAGEQEAEAKTEIEKETAPAAEILALEEYAKGEREEWKETSCSMPKMPGFPMDIIKKIGAGLAAVTVLSVFAAGKAKLFLHHNGHKRGMPG